LNSIFLIIHISEDKNRQISELNELLSGINLTEKVFINPYSHPENGYGNENEDHIDRKLKPNATYPNLRDKLFDECIKNRNALNNVLKKSEIIIRGVLDDDDFISECFLKHIIDSATNIITQKSINTFIMVNKRILVSYFNSSSQAITVHDVIFDRVINGCKYSVSTSLKRLPLHPFAISETVNSEIISKRGIIDVFDISNYKKNECKLFSYNRHLMNLSNNSKSFFYTELLTKRDFNNHLDFLAWFNDMELNK